jgi:hypothetical protein
MTRLRSSSSSFRSTNSVYMSTLGIYVEAIYIEKKIDTVARSFRILCHCCSPHLVREELHRKRRWKMRSELEHQFVMFGCGSRNMGA